PAQLVLLVGRGLVLRRYPQIDRSAFHGFAPLRTGASVLPHVVRFNSSYAIRHFCDERALNSLHFLHGTSAGFLHTLLPTMATTRGRCSTTSATGTSSTRSDTPKWRPTGSRTFGEATEACDWDQSRCPHARAVGWIGCAGVA